MREALLPPFLSSPQNTCFFCLTLPKPSQVFWGILFSSASFLLLICSDVMGRVSRWTISWPFWPLIAKLRSCGLFSFLVKVHYWPTFSKKLWFMVAALLAVALGGIYQLSKTWQPCENIHFYLRTLQGKQRQRDLHILSLSPDIAEAAATSIVKWMKATLIEC